MNRRDFATLSLAGIGLAALPRSLASATLPSFPEAVPQARGPLTSRDVILARAKAALDRHQRSILLRDRVAIADFTAPSRDLRFHIVDLVGGQVNSYLVAHGKGSDPEHSGWLERFSNVPNSEATSDGAYRTGDIYYGQHGQSMRLVGLDPDNSNAEPRAIVVHGADYVSEDHIAAWGKLGRSQGCFAVAPHMLPQVLGLLGPGRLLYSDKA